MTDHTASTPFSRGLGRAFFRSLKEVLTAAGYADQPILQRMGVKKIPAISETDAGFLLYQTKGNRPLDILIRLFLMDVPVEAKALKRAIHPMKLADWIQAGLVRHAGAHVTARVRILPFDRMLIAFDRQRMLANSERAHEYVMGIGQSTLTLVNLMVNRHSRHTLDLGSGCGVLSFLAARHSDRVVGVDRNPRAVAMAAFNAALNEYAHVAFREGDLFKPVDKERFDLIVTNPPFVISPESRYIYRDGNMEGDDLCRAIVGEVPKRLNEGGYCQLLCNWIERNGEDWGQRLKQWFDGSGCDVWVMRSESRSADVYASTWIRHTERDRNTDIQRLFSDWMAYYEDQRVESIGAGVITLRRRTGGDNWYRADEAPEKMVGPCGPSIEESFARRTLLESLRLDGNLLALKVKASPHLRLERIEKPTEKGWQIDSMRLRLAAGLAYTGAIDPYMADAVMRCNGDIPLAHLMNALAGQLNQPAETISAPFCGIVRDLILKGFLIPADEHMAVDENRATADHDRC